MDEFKIFSIIEDYYPALVNDDILSEIASFFDEYQEKNARSIDDWEHPDAIDDYASSVEELGCYFSIDIKPTLKYFTEQKKL